MSAAPAVRLAPTIGKGVGILTDENLALDVLGEGMGRFKDTGLGAKEDMPEPTEPLGEGIGTGEPRARLPTAIPVADTSTGLIVICAPFVSFSPTEPREYMPPAPSVRSGA